MAVFESFEYITQRTQGFVGRKWVFSEIDHWLANPGGSRCFVITGEPGVGKTAVAARLVQFSNALVPPLQGMENLRPGFLSAFHFCIPWQVDTTDPLIFTRHISSQLTKNDDFAHALINRGGITLEAIQNVSENYGQAINIMIRHLTVNAWSAVEAFAQVVLAPLAAASACNPRQLFVILIDGLDEAARGRADGSIVDLVARADGLPQNVRFLMTSRVDSLVLRYFGDQCGFLMMNQARGDNQRDVQLFIEQQLSKSVDLETHLQQQKVSVRRFTEALTIASQSNFLYLSHMLSEISLTTLSSITIEHLPIGLDDVYRRFLMSCVAKDLSRYRIQYRPILGLLAVARLPLALVDVARILNLELQLLHDSLTDLSQFFDPILLAEEQYFLYHQSIVDFLSDRSRAGDLWIDLTASHRVVVNYYVTQFLGKWKDCDLYGLRSLIHHLAEVGENSRLLALLNDDDWNEAKQRLDPTGYSYTRDLQQAISIAEAEGIGGLHFLTAHTFRMALHRTRAAKIPVVLISTLIRCGQIAQALRYTQLMPPTLESVQALLVIGETLLDQAHMQPAQSVFRSALGCITIAEESSTEDTSWLVQTDSPRVDDLFRQLLLDLVKARDIYGLEEARGFIQIRYANVNALSAPNKVMGIVDLACATSRMGLAADTEELLHWAFTTLQEGMGVGRYSEWCNAFWAKSLAMIAEGFFAYGNHEAALTSLLQAIAYVTGQEFVVNKELADSPEIWDDISSLRRELLMSADKVWSVWGGMTASANEPKAIALQVEALARIGALLTQMGQLELGDRFIRAAVAHNPQFDLLRKDAVMLVALAHAVNVHGGLAVRELFSSHLLSVLDVEDWMYDSATELLVNGFVPAAKAMVIIGEKLHLRKILSVIPRIKYGDDQRRVFVAAVEGLACLDDVEGLQEAGLLVLKIRGAAEFIKCVTALIDAFMRIGDVNAIAEFVALSDHLNPDNEYLMTSGRAILLSQVTRAVARLACTQHDSRLTQLTMRVLLPSALSALDNAGDYGFFRRNEKPEAIASLCEGLLDLGERAEALRLLTRMLADVQRIDEYDLARIHRVPALFQLIEASGQNRDIAGARECIDTLENDVKDCATWHFVAGLLRQEDPDLELIVLHADTVRNAGYKMNILCDTARTLLMLSRFDAGIGFLQNAEVVLSQLESQTMRLRGQFIIADIGLEAGLSSYTSKFTYVLDALISAQDVRESRSREEVLQTLLERVNDERQADDECESLSFDDMYWLARQLVQTAVRARLHAEGRRALALLVRLREEVVDQKAWCADLISIAKNMTATSDVAGLWELHNLNPRRQITNDSANYHLGALHAIAEGFAAIGDGEALDRLTDEVRRMEDAYFLIHGLSDLGYAYATLRASDRAADLLREAIALATDIYDPCDKATAFVPVVVTLYRIDAIEEARQILNQAIATGKGDQRRGERESALDRLAWASARIGLYKQAFELVNCITDQGLRALTWRDIALALIANREYIKAMSVIEDAANYIDILANLRDTVLSGPLDFKDTVDVIHKVLGMIGRVSGYGQFWGSIRYLAPLFAQVDPQGKNSVLTDIIRSILKHERIVSSA